MTTERPSPESRPVATRPRSKRGLGWLAIFLITFLLTSYLIRDGQWAGLTLEPAPTSEAEGSLEVPPSDQGDRDLASPASGAPQLTEIGPDLWQSPAGLIYGPGSAEGHRLRHLARHLQDAPERPVHGVFNGSLDDVLGWIDEAYRMSQADATGVRTRAQDNRVQITAPLAETIGYVGGEQGAAAGFPPTRILRLILEDDRVITAYPDWPPR